VKTKNHLLRFNVGFIIHEDVGYSKEFPLEFDELDIQPDMQLNNVKGKIIFDRTPQGILAKVHLSGYTAVECVLCLDEFEQALDTQFAELFAFDERSVDDEGLIVPEEGVIDLTPLVRDYLQLEIPIKTICRPDCPGLDPETGEKRTARPTEEESQHIDPRLAILKKLLDEEE
jgi:uncharacterized protein